MLWCVVVCVLFVSAPTYAQFWKKEQPQLLPEEQAFAVSATVNEAGILAVAWSIADDYYMYREQTSVEVTTAGVEAGDWIFPSGVVEDDPEFGEVEVYFYNLLLSAPLSGDFDSNEHISIAVKGQGCNKPVGVCYPPMVRTLQVELPEISSGNAATPPSANSENQSQHPKSIWAYMLSAFGAGLLLSFTPCVLPMVPILAGVIAGQKQSSRWRSGALSLSYVVGTIVTYIAAGALAGATGAQLQAWFQNIWVIGAVCGLLLLLALSLFGLFKIELPSALQTRLHGLSGNSHSAYLSSFVLGLISALVVGACVSPVLILALGAAISQGDPVLGAAIMGSMALGMGMLLILFGFGAGWLLPRAGAWMQHVQILFGFMVLGVAVYLLGAFPEIPALFLWSVLLLTGGFYIWQIASKATPLLSSSVLHTLATLLILWGSVAAVGGFMGGGDILRPLENFQAGASPQAQNTLPFTKVTSLQQTQEALAQAQAQNQPVMLDFYADWCLDCRRMHKTTYRDLAVQAALERWALIEVDVTETSAVSNEVKQYFQVFGPPATLFFNARGEQREDLSQYGYIKVDRFLSLLAEVEAKQ